MLDTVKLCSPHVTDQDAARIERHCTLRQAVEIATGEVQYSLTTGSLAGSWDDRVSVRVMREKIVTLEATQKSKAVATVEPCEPYLLLEGSVHKALLGHNVHGGPLAPLLACCWFVDDVARRLGVSLPYAEDWHVQRIDWAEVYELPSFEAVQEFISGLSMAEFPRRKVYRYGAESVFSPGRTTAIKAYHKGPEFYKHDRARLRDCLTDGELVELQECANRLLRFETSVKARKLAEDFKGKPLVVQLSRDYLEGVHDREAARLLKEANTEMETVRTHLEVSRRLQHTYSQELANRLFGTWMQLATLGEAEVRKQMSRPTFFRQRKQLTDAGCSWNAADVQIVARHSAIPLGFAPVRSDPRRLTEEAEAVSYKLTTYQRAA
jgi:II/X family phage/plasmid replication protein